MSESFFTIARYANNSLIFNELAQESGFSSIGEIDRFVFGPYKKVIRDTQPADLPRGVIFILEPASVSGVLGAPSALGPLLKQIQSAAASTFHSIRIDLADGLSSVYTCTPADRRFLVSGGWTKQIACEFSQHGNKCVIWATGVSVHVFINGRLYLESADVVEEFAAGCPREFENLSWDDGRIAFAFADRNLNDRGPLGIWCLPDDHLLRPRPEVLIRSRFGDFLRYRLALYHTHYEEAHVENEGRADISLHLIDGRILIVEIKWIGHSLVRTHIGAKVDEIKEAIARNKRGWLTRFDDTTITSGIRQLVRYYKTGRYHRAYLTVFDCSPSARKNDSCCISAPASELNGHSDDNFRILRACVDPRPASGRSKP